MTSRRFRQALLLIVLAALALRVGYVLAVTQFDTGFYDAAFYESEAHAVADGRGFVDPFPGHAGQEAADHPPLTVLVLIPAAELPGDSQLWMRFTMALLGAAVVALIALLARALAGDRVGAHRRGRRGRVPEPVDERRADHVRDRRRLVHRGGAAARLPAAAPADLGCGRRVGRGLRSGGPHARRAGPVGAVPCSPRRMGRVGVVTGAPSCRPWG